MYNYNNLIEMSCYDGYSMLCLHCQASPINLPKTKVSSLKSHLKISASDSQNKSDIFNWIFFNKKYRGQWNIKLRPSLTTHRSQKTQALIFLGTFLSAYFDFQWWRKKFLTEHTGTSSQSMWTKEVRNQEFYQDEQDLKSVR